MAELLRVAIAEDHYLVREGTRRALEAGGEIAVVAAVDCADELEDAVARLRPDVVVTDIRMPQPPRPAAASPCESPAEASAASRHGAGRHHTEGIDAAHRLRARYRGLGVVVLSQYADASYAFELLRDGPAGLAYLLKERVGDPAGLVGAVREVAAGGSVIDPDVVSALVGRNLQPRSPLAGLTERERDVLELMAQGRTNAGVAQRLHVSESSVEKYATSIFAKLGLGDEPQTHRRVAAVLAFLRDEGRAKPL